MLAGQISQFARRPTDPRDSLVVAGIPIVAGRNRQRVASWSERQEVCMHKRGHPQRPGLRGGWVHRDAEHFQTTGLSRCREIRVQPIKELSTARHPTARDDAVATLGYDGLRRSTRPSTDGQKTSCARAADLRLIGVRKLGGVRTEYRRQAPGGYRPRLCLPAVGRGEDAQSGRLLHKKIVAVRPPLAAAAFEPNR
jgi:hypothetical protein